MTLLTYDCIWAIREKHVFWNYVCPCIAQINPITAEISFVSAVRTQAFHIAKQSL